VVVVNDDPGVLDLYRDILRELEYEPVAMATTAIETERIRAHEPDAVILDLEVGSEAMYGVAMATQLRDDARLANIPIVVCTGNPDALDGARVTLHDLGVPMLIKPFSIDEIETALSAPVPVSNRPVIAPVDSPDRA
jgi:DNA-binding response OmpR family regulator